jgi:Protein of unknown function (DUF3467)
MTETSDPAAANQSPRGSAAAPSSPTVDASTLDSRYVNFCRVTGMPEEVIIDFGLSTDPAEMSSGSMLATDRVVLSFYTGKRLLEALQVTISRHEAAFGPLELNAKKRFVPGKRG